MNKHKLTVLVEGLAELIFVRQLLSAWFEYDSEKVGFVCLALYKDDFKERPHPFGSKESESYYQIINIGNDARVVSKILQLSSNLHSNGFSVLGLRDMYSEMYLEQAKKRGMVTVHEDLNQRFIVSMNQTIDNNLPEDIRKDVNLCFAIMEVEAWLLAMKDSDAKDIEQIFHPTQEFKKRIMPEYGKHSSQIEGVVSELSKEDYIQLYKSNRCPSFNNFLEHLIPEEYFADAIQFSHIRNN